MSDPGDFLKAQFVIFRCQKYVKKGYIEMRKWIYLEPSKSVPGCSIFHDLRDYKPSKAKKQFSDVKNISREKARRPKKTSTSCNLITQCNPLLPNIKTIIKKHLPVLHSSHEMLQISPENNVNVTYRLNKNWKEPISPSLFPRTIKKHLLNWKMWQKMRNL